VLAVNGNTLVMKGDALDKPDPWQVTVSSAKGIYMFKIPYIGYLLSFIRTKLGWFLSIIIPAAAIVGFLIKDILKEAFTDKKESLDKGGVRVNAKEQRSSVRVQTIMSKTPVLDNTRLPKETIRKPQTTLSKAQIESNARLRSVLINALEMQKTSR
jgi:hypothetical protein